MKKACAFLFVYDVRQPPLMTRPSCWCFSFSFHYFCPQEADLLPCATTPQGIVVVGGHVASLANAETKRMR